MFIQRMGLMACIIMMDKERILMLAKKREIIHIALVEQIQIIMCVLVVMQQHVQMITCTG